MSTIADLPASAATQGNPSADGGFSGGQDGQGREETVSWSVDWADRGAFEAAVMGYPVTVSIPGGTLTRTIPLECPYSYNMKATSFRWKSVGKRGTSEAFPYTKCIYQVNFGFLPYPTAGDGAFQSIQAQGAARQVTNPSIKYTFAGNSEVVDHGIAVNYPSVSYLLNIYKVPDVAAFGATMLPLLATPVNNASLTLGGLTFPAGTILLESYSTTSTRSLLGIEEHTATVALAYSSLPWNKAARSDGVVDTLVPAPYVTGDLSAMFS